MTVAQLLRRFQQAVAFDLDPVFGAYPGVDDAAGLATWTADALGFLNEAALELATLAYLTRDAVSLALSPGVGTYRLDSAAFSGRLLQPFSVTVGGRRLKDAAGSAYGLWTVDELTRRFPTWVTDPAGVVRCAVFRGDRLILYPAPAAAGVASVEGKVGPALMVATALDAVPDLPERLHGDLVSYAVYLACKDNAQDGSQFNRLTLMRDGATAKAAEVRRDNMNAQVGNASTSSSQLTPVMRV